MSTNNIKLDEEIDFMEHAASLSHLIIAEMSVTMPVPEWGGQEFRLPLEQDVAFTPTSTHFLDGRQTKFHLVR